MSPAGIGIDHIQALAGYDTPTIANAMESLQISERHFTGPQIRLATAPVARVVGVAVTATMKEQWSGKFAHLDPWLQFLEQIETLPLPAVAIFHDESEQAGISAMIGEGMSRAMRAAGAVGALCDGVIRDISPLSAMAWPVWAAGAAADRAGIRFHRHQAPVQIAGMRVHPGDVGHADENGALIVPAERVQEVIDAAAKIVAKEAGMFAMFSKPGFRVSQLYDFYAPSLRAARVERDCVRSRTASPPIDG
jgi:4-hydroxy-4-methyl-2-oxoglutarate aldolase